MTPLTDRPRNVTTYQRVQQLIDAADYWSNAHWTLAFNRQDRCDRDGFNFHIKRAVRCEEWARRLQQFLDVWDAQFDEGST